MVRKIFSWLLAIATLVTSVMVPVYAEENTGAISYYEPTEREDLLINLGIIDKTGYNGEDKMTRGEFAVFLAKILRIDTTREEEESTSVPGLDDSEIVNPVSSVFKDVNKSSEEFGAIMSVYENGYMNGLSEELFAPEYNLVFSDALKVFIDLLGFYDQAEAQGGFPKGYSKLASSFNLYKGVSCRLNDVATKRDIASLLVNVMETPIAKVSSFDNGGVNYQTSKEKTFMSEVMKLQKITGVMTDNGITGIKGPSSVSPKQVICDGIVMSLSDNVAYARKYLGRRIVAYYSTAEDGVYSLVYAKPTDDIITIAEKDYMDYDNGVLKYATKNGSVKTANIGRFTGIIYNGMYMTNYTKDIFNVTDGQIILIKNNGSYTVIIEDYKSVIVSKTVEEKSMIYSGIYFGSTRHGFNDICLDDYEEVTILNQDREPIAFSDIAEGNVLSCLLSPNYRYAELILCSDKKEAVKITGVNADEYESDDENYLISDILRNATNLEPVRIGYEYTLYFSAFGTLVWIEKPDSSEDRLNEGILLKLMEPNYDMEYNFGIKVYTSNGLVKTYYIKDKFKLNNSTVKAEKAYIVDVVEENGEEKIVESGLLYDCNAIGKPILYSEEDSVIKELVTPLGYNEEDDNRGWYQITYDYLADEDKDKGLKHIDAGNGASFGGMLNYDRSSCNIYGVPHSSLGTPWETREFITINETEFVNHQEYRIEGYAKTKDAICADVLVERQKGTSGVPDSRVALLITDVHFVLNADMEIMTTFSGYEFVQPGTVTKTTYVVSDDAKIVNESNVVTGKSYKDLTEGDIIRISKNAKGEISFITVSYDYSEDKVTNITCREQAYTNKGYVMKIDGQGFKIVVPGEITSGAGTESVFYTPFQVQNYIQSASTPEQVKEGFQMIRTYHAGANYPVVIVDSTTRKPTFTQASLDDVFSYEKTPGKYDTMVVCTHYLGGKMGAVVYR